ncbi:kinase A anchor protein [Fusarium redolens]|uniref:Kinase A anchor protein n=1 Tax=Fusarium redolens TaxID=48865 RepID=A0A9P9HLE6_FUSRE|nr:kinase A anchor protein [Fusarium redolens]KAH7259715.1 kinase A anchor protein [Fusarium redolens]
MPPKPVRASPTHFVCIPLAGPQLARSLAAFRTEVTNPSGFGVPPTAVRPLGTMHLTLGVMSLKDEGDEQASEVLKSLKLSEFLASARAGKASTEEGLLITLKGLHAFQNSEKTSVLYAPPVDTEGILYKFCEQIKATFQEVGLMTKEDRPLVLHATVVNTIYVKDGRGRRREKLTIDARDIVSSYDDFVWLEDMPLDKITLCRMGAKKIEGTDDEAYEVVAEVGF